MIWITGFSLVCPQIRKEKEKHERVFTILGLLPKVR